MKDSTKITNQSGGVDLHGDANIEGDVVGRDKIVQIINESHTKRNTIYAAITLALAVLGCLAAWLTVPQVQNMINSLSGNSLSTQTPDPIASSTPLNVAVPSPTFFSTSVPTLSPTPTLETKPTATVSHPTATVMPDLTVDDFENYNQASLADTFKINRNAGNEANISLVGKPHAIEGRQAMSFEYDIRRDSDQYVGFDRAILTQDWSGYKKLCAWIESDGSNRTLIIQLGETETKIIGKESPFSLASGSDDYCVQLQDQQQYVDLKNINYYGVYVEGPPSGIGLIYIDNIRVVP
jgi:hypothetical protein